LKEKTPQDKTFYWSEKVKNILVELGFSEIMLYSLAPKGAFEIEYPLASDKAALRESIVPKMQESLKMNTLNADLLGLDAIKIFEIGKVFPKEGEKTVLTIGVALVKKRKGVTALSFIEEAINAVSVGFNIEIDDKLLKLSRDLSDSNDRQCVEIYLDFLVKSLPPIGSIAGLNFKPLSKNKKYQHFSLYPFIVRDIAVFVPESIEADTVWQIIEKSISTAKATELLARHSLFDTFKKEGKVSYAFRMIFQSKERTLTDADVNAIMEKIYSEVRKNNWEVR